jgi:hypothetical protein
LQIFQKMHHFTTPPLGLNSGEDGSIILLIRLGVLLTLFIRKKMANHIANNVAQHQGAQNQRLLAGNADEVQDED